MSTDRDVTRIVRSWLNEDRHEDADRVLNTVLDQLDATPQRRPLWSAWRFPAMSNTVRIALAAAAVVVVAVIAVIGYQFLSGPNVGGPGPSASPSVAPTATAEIPRAIGAIDPGTYYMDDPTWTPVRFTFTVPAGWTTRSDGYVYKHSDAPRELGFFPWIVTHVYASACDSAGTLIEVGPTVDDLVRALVDQSESESSTPVDITLGGYPGTRIDMSIPADLDTDACRNPGIVQIWADEAETGFFVLSASGAEVPGSVYIANVNGHRVVITAGHSPESSAADIAELQGIIASIDFQR